MAFSPCAFWNATNAAWVFGPILPSTFSLAPLALSAVCNLSIRCVCSAAAGFAFVAACAWVGLVALAALGAGVVAAAAAGAAGTAAAGTGAGTGVNVMGTGAGGVAGDAGAWAKAGVASRAVAIAKVTGEPRIRFVMGLLRNGMVAGGHSRISFARASGKSLP